jgi:hypothetical protein
MFDRSSQLEMISSAKILNGLSGLQGFGSALLLRILNLSFIRVGRRMLNGVALDHFRKKFENHRPTNFLGMKVGIN